MCVYTHTYIYIYIYVSRFYFPHIFFLGDENKESGGGTMNPTRKFSRFIYLFPYLFVFHIKKVMHNIECILCIICSMQDVYVILNEWSLSYIYERNKYICVREFCMYVYVLREYKIHQLPPLAPYLFCFSFFFPFFISMRCKLILSSYEYHFIHYLILSHEYNLCIYKNIATSCCRYSRSRVSKLTR